MVVDWPENRMRVLHRMLWVSELDEIEHRLQDLIEICHENRMNGLLFQSNLFWRLGNEKVVSTLAGADFLFM